MSDYLDQIEAQLAELTDRGAHRRLRARRPGLGVAGTPSSGGRPRRRRTEALAFLSAAAVAIAVVAIVVLNVGTSKPPHASAPAAGSERQSTTKATTAPRTATTTQTASSTVSPLPPHSTTDVYPQSFTAISELTWWLLGKGPCSLASQQSPCGAILRTTDGGRTFTPLEAPRASLANDLSPSGYSQIRFADLKNGFAYDPNLYATHDGGATWQPIRVDGDVSALAISGGEVYAIVGPPPGSAGQLMRSPVGQNQWTPVTAAGRVSGGLWVLGQEVLAQTASGPGYGSDLLVSTDGGASFDSVPAPSPGLPCALEAQSPPIIWAQCATGTESGVWRSTDYGRSFVTAHGSGLPPLPNSAVFGAASDNTAVAGYNQLYRTDDAGTTWTPTGPSGISEWTYIGFTDSTHGVALGYAGSVANNNQRLYYTTDGGQTYHLVPLQ
jgi:photosystem II stability/assembly factor-like uncharacterized protein